MPLNPSDRTEILDLIATYGTAWDSADAETFTGLFTEDAICAFYRNDADTPSALLEGRRALHQAVDARAGRFKTIGLVTNHIMSESTLTALDEDTVGERTDVRVFWQAPATDPEPRPVQTGHYDGVVVRTDDGWRFAKRAVRLNGLFEVADVYPNLDH